MLLLFIYSYFLPSRAVPNTPVSLKLIPNPPKPPIHLLLEAPVVDRWNEVL